MQLWADDGHAYTMFQGACADTDVIIGTEPYQNGFAWATSTGANSLTWGCPASGSSGGLGLPSRIDVGLITDNCCSSPVDNFDVGGTIVALKTAPHPQGIWIVWQTDAESPRLIHWRRYELTPPKVAASGTIGTSNDVPVDFATAALGNQLVVAWSNAANTPAIMLTMIDEVRAPRITQARLTPPTLHNLSLLAGPDRAGLLLGFPNGYLANIRCAEYE
jgi:hypothetical protein